MSESLAIDGCTIDHSTPSVISGGSFTITSAPSTKYKADGKGVYKTPIAFTFTGGSHSLGVGSTAVGSGTIIATTSKNLAEGLPIAREGDTGVMIGTYTQKATPSPIPGVPFTSNVEITDAGQIKVLGE